MDLGSHSVKICRLSRSMNDFRLTGYYEQALHQTQRLSHEEAVGAALKTLLDRYQLTADVISVGFPAHLLSCRILELPFGNVKKIEQVVEFELESHIPVPLEELLVDYHILELGQERSIVLAAYVPKARFVKYLDLLQVAGADPKFIGVDSINLSRMTQISMVPHEAVYALIDIGHQKTNICIMEGADLRYVRTVSIGGLHFTRVIQKHFHLNLEKAEGLKLDRGRVSHREEELDQISRLCQKIAEELIVAVRQTYLGYLSVYPGKEWSSVFLTGGTSRMAGLSDFFSSALQVNVHSLDCLNFINHDLSQPELCGDVIAPSLSQTLRVILSHKAIKINFRRGPFAYKRDIKAIGSEIRQLGFLFALVVILGLSHFAFSYFMLSKRIEHADDSLVETAVKAIPELKSQKQKGAKQMLNVITGKIAEIQPQVDALAASGTRATALRLLLEFSEKVPAKEEVQIDVDVFSYTGDHIRIEGRTNSFEAVDKIKSALETSSYFRNVTTQNVNKGIRDEIKFSLSMDVAGEGGGT